MIEISNSEMSKWARCPRLWMIQYYYGAAPADPPATSPAQQGTRIHAALEGWRGHGLDPLEILAELYGMARTAHPDADPELRREWETSEIMVTGYLEWLAEHGHDAELTTVAAEREVTVPLPGFEDRVMLTAKLDTIERDADGNLYFRDYKGLALDTKIPTPSGWTTIRDVRTGDIVFGRSGEPCRVTAKSAVHYRTCYRLRFDDGSSVVCDDEHLWKTLSGIPTDIRSGIRTAEEIAGTLRIGRQCHHRVQMAAALDLPDADLPVDPWVLGYWLGNGHRTSGVVTSHADDAPEIHAAILSAGYQTGAYRKDPRADSITIRITGLTKQLAGIGVLGNKHIPAEYLRGSAAQRLALLRGLMDSDGHWNQVRSQAVLSTVRHDLALQVRELAVSLGQRAVVHTVRAHGFGKDVTAYPVTFRPVGIVPFALSRKADGASRVKPSVKSTRRVIVAADEVLTVPTQCISVDSPDSTYLCTEWMIPTHNTAASFQRHEYLSLDPQFKVYSLIMALRRAEQGEHEVTPRVLAMGGFVDTLRRCKRSGSSQPPYYMRDYFRYNAAELESTARRVGRICCEILESREQLDRCARDYGNDLAIVNRVQQEYCRPVPVVHDCSWSCPFTSICPAMDDGSDWPGMLTQSGRWVQADPYSYRSLDLLGRARQRLAATVGAP